MKKRSPRKTSTKSLDLDKAAIMASLINLNKACENGDELAAKLILDCGLIISDMLYDGVHVTDADSPVRRAFDAAARNSMRWPVSCPAFEDQRLRIIKAQIPSNLGKDVQLRLSKNEGTKADRDLQKQSRVGFALTFHRDLDVGRQLFKKYPDHTIAEVYLWELVDQGIRAGQILHQPHLNLGPIETDATTHNAIVNSLTIVTPPGLEAVWERMRELPDLTPETVDVWVGFAMDMAEARCEGDWPRGIWPHKLVGDADSRVSAVAIDDVKATKEAVKNWLLYGFKAIARKASHLAADL